MTGKEKVAQWELPHSGNIIVSRSLETGVSCVVYNDANQGRVKGPGTIDSESQNGCKMRTNVSQDEAREFLGSYHLDSVIPKPRNFM